MARLLVPFARLRPGAQLGAEVHIGNFVEVKNSTMAKGAKANRLAYLGDATVGERVNYGAGSITANYDGVNKHRTVIEADVQDRKSTRLNSSHSQISYAVFCLKKKKKQKQTKIIYSEAVQR